MNALAELEDLLIACERGVLRSLPLPERTELDCMMERSQAGFKRRLLDAIPLHAKRSLLDAMRRRRSKIGISERLTLGDLDLPIQVKAQLADAFACGLWPASQRRRPADHQHRTAKGDD